MSWIGSGLSQITGQISNFTKEVLTEGTEEVDDHVTALQLTRSRLAEQEAHSSAYRSEVDKLKHINDDLTEKLQSAELQSNAISKEYRAQLDEREEEIKKLKQKQNEMLDFQGKMAAASSSQPTLSHSASVPLLTAFGSDEHDFDDVISSQHEINRLRSEVQRLLAESHHWRQVAASSQAQAQNAGTDIAVGQEESSAALQARIKEIQQEVSDEIDQHQRELATLQDVHTQKMATIKKKHKDEIRQYQDQVQELQEELQAGSRQNEGSDLTDSRSQQMDQENAKSKTALQEAEKRTQQLQEKTTVLEQEKLKLKSEIDAANERLKQQETEIQNLKRSTNLDNDLANSDGSVVDTSLKHALREATLPSSTPLRSPRPDSVIQGSEVDSRCLTSDFSDSTLSVRNKELDDQVRTLLKQIEAYEQEIEHFEFVKSDWLMEKEALEDVLLKLRQELSQKEEMLSVIQAKKGLAEIQQQEGKKRKKRKANEDIGEEEQGDIVDSSTESHSFDEDDDIEVHIDHLNHQVALLTQGSAQVESERNSLAAEKDILLEELVKQKQRVAELEEQLQSDSASTSETDSQLLHQPQSTKFQDLEAQISSLTNQLEQQGIELNEKDIEISHLNFKLDDTTNWTEANSQGSAHDEYKSKFEEVQVEKESLEKSLDELDTQHQEALFQIIATRDELLKKNDELKGNITELEEQLSQFENDTGKVAKDTSLKALAEDGENLRKQAHDLESENASLPKERQALEIEMNEVKSKLNNCNVMLESLQNDKEALSKTVSKLQQEIEHSGHKNDSLVTEKSHLKHMCEGLEDKLNTAREQLKLAQQAAANHNQEHVLEKDLDKVRAELSENSNKSQVLQDRISELEAEVDSLQGHLTLTNQEKLDLHTKLQEVQRQFSVQKTELEKSFHKQLKDSTTRADSLQTQKLSLEKDLDKGEQKMQEQAKQFESYIKELTQARDMDTNSLQTEHEKLMKVMHEKNLKISELESKCELLENDLEHTKDMLQSTFDGQQQITDLINEKETEISTLQAENTALVECNEDVNVVIKRHEAELGRLGSIEQKYKNIFEENKKLKIDIENLRDQFKQLESQEDSEKMESKTLDIITDLESEITSLNSKIEEQNSLLEKYKKDAKKLQDELGEKEASLRQANDKYDKQCKTLKQTSEVAEKQETMITNLQHGIAQKEQEVAVAYNKLEKTKSQLLGGESQHESTNDKKMNILQNSTVNENKNLENGEMNGESTFSYEEIEKFKEIISQKDSVITEMQGANGSLLKMLEEKSMSLYGNKALVEVHKLESEVKQSRMEREQILSVLNEKSRECSKLKVEVHKLMNVVSAEKQALSKLQQDNHRLMQTKEEANTDMTKEAIQSLSRMVRDKDLEVESLNLKNQTLLQVLQESSQHGMQLSTLMQERDNLVKQIQAYQADREQIISALNQKHQESVAYHAEIQRLNEVRNKENEEQDKLQHGYSSLMKQYEDKQQALLKAQNEVLNYKEKFQEVDSLYQELLQKSKESQAENECPLEQKSEEVDRLTAEVQRLSQSLSGRDEVISEKDKEITNHERLLQGKDRNIGEFNVNMRKLEEVLRSRESEFGALRKQHENLAFQLQGLQTEVSYIKQERDHLAQRNTTMQAEVAILKDAQNKLNMVLGEKDFEINALKEKANTLAKLVQETGVDEKGEMDRMMQESEAMQKQARVFQHERDQVVVAFQQSQTQSAELQTQVEAFQEREHKLRCELERLRGHLIQIEEGYTQEALEAEEREKELRNRLAAAEEKAYSSTTAVRTASEQAHHEVADLQSQLRRMADQRDRAQLQLQSVQETANQYAASLANLQMVLEQFQLERDTQQVVEMEKYQKTQDHLLRENQAQAQLVAELKRQLDETQDALEAAQRLSEQLDLKEEAMTALKEEVILRENELKRVEEELQKFSSSSDAKVDKIVIKSLILGYFHTQSGNKTEALRLLGKVLDFNHEEMYEVGAEGASGVGWFTGILKKVANTPTPPTTPKRPPLDKSFSELFVKFLEKESTPQPKLQVKLPAEEMAREQQQKQHQQHSRQKPLFNPFSAPRHVTVPVQIGAAAAADDAHILMKPMASSLPMFSPMVQPELANPAPPGDGSRRNSATVTNSGRSTPATVGTSALRDVLQQ